MRTAVPDMRMRTCSPQTIEGLWHHCKDFLPSSGMKPRDVHSYLGAFMWHRYAKQRKLDMFLFLLKCSAEIFPPVQNLLPIAQMNPILVHDNDFEEC